MKVLSFVLKTTLVLAAFLVPPTWLVATNHGLKTTLMVSSWFVPGKVVYEQVYGTILGKQITLKNLQLSKSEHILKISSIDIIWQQGLFSAHNVRGFTDFFPNADLLVANNNAVIDQITGDISLGQTSQNLRFTANGKWQDTRLNSTMNITHFDDGTWVINSGILNIGQNTASLAPSSNDGFTWELNLTQPQIIFKDSTGTIYASGSIANLNTQPWLQATVKADKFSIQDYAIKNLNAKINAQNIPQAPLNINISADSLMVNNEIVSGLKLNINGTLNKHTLNSSLKYEAHPLSLTATGSLKETVWNSDNLRVNYKKDALLGNAKFDTNSHNGELSLNGKIQQISTKAKLEVRSADDLNLNLQLLANQYNKMQATLNYTAGKIDGLATAQAEDLSLIMQLLPDVTRLKGKLTAEFKISGKIDNPTIGVNAHVTDVTATLPALGIKIKPMELHLRDNGRGKLILTGAGKMRRGPGEFSLEGFIEPLKPNIPNEVTLTAKNLEFINNDQAQLIASNKLKFVYDLPEHRLDILGDIDIEQGKIHFNSKSTSTVKSKDVVFTDSITQTKKNVILLNPQINLRISEGVHFSGFGLDADITGKLDINQRHNAIYGTGRVTIKQGTYKLPGQVLQIQKGRLLYPPGTLLANPTLDIKMHGKNEMAEHAHNENGSEIELFVRGTAQAPTIHEVGIGNNKDRALSQAILAGSSVLSKNLLQDKLKITELGVTSNNQNQQGFFDDPTKNASSLKNKNIVVGRPLGNRLYLQYLHSMSEANQKVRLKYALNKNWAVGLESGNQGTGADLSFSMETD